MELLFIFIFLGIFAIISYRNILWGFYLIIFLLPAYLIRFKIGGIPFTFLEGMTLILTAIWLYKKIKDRQLVKFLQTTKYKIQNTRYRWPILLFLTAAAISVFVSPNKLSAFGDFRAFFVEPLIFFVIFLDLVKTEKEIKNIFYALGGGAIYISLFAIFQFFTGFMVPENYLEERRMTSFYSYPAAVGLFLAPVLAMFIGIIIEKLKTQNSKLPASSDQAKPDKTMAQNLKLKINQQSKAMDALTYWEKIFLGFSLVTIALSTLALLATKTEGAYLGVLAAVFIILMFTPWYKWILAGSLIISLTILAIPPSRQYVIQKATFSDTSGDVRKVLWQGTFRALKENPIFGGGLSGFPDLYKQYKEKKHVELLKYPHNIIFNFWTETGILGLISFFWLVFVFFKNIFKKYPLNANRYTLTAIAAAMLALLIYGLLDVPYFKNDLSTLFWVLIGLALV